MNWKDINGYEGIYKINEFGQVKKLETKMPMPNGGFRLDTEKIIKPLDNFKGYPYVRICKNNTIKTITVHRLVAIHFIPNPLNKPQVNHLDRNKKNSHFLNLEWVTNKENMDHYLRSRKTNPQNIH